MARGDPSFSLLWDLTWICALNLLNGDRDSDEAMEDGGCGGWRLCSCAAAAGVPNQTAS